MFKRDVKSLSDLLQMVLRKEGFETPLLQRRLVASWDAVVGPTISRYTSDKFIKNQTFYVFMTFSCYSNPVLFSIAFDVHA